MLKYIVYKSGVNNATKDKWYARIVHEETVDIEGLAEHMRRHNAPYSKGQLKGIITDMVSCIHELTTQGKKVKLPDLGIFRIRTQGKGAKSLKELSTMEHILFMNLGFRPVGDMRSRTWGDDHNLYGVKWKRVERVENGREGV